MLASAPLTKPSAQAHETPNGLDELRRVITHTIFKHGFYFFDVIYFRGGVTVNYHKVCLLASSQGADSVHLAEEFRAVGASDVDRLHRRETRFHQQFHFTLIAESGDHPAVARGIETGEQ